MARRSDRGNSSDNLGIDLLIDDRCERRAQLARKGVDYVRCELSTEMTASFVALVIALSAWDQSSRVTRTGTWVLRLVNCPLPSRLIVENPRLRPDVARLIFRLVVTGQRYRRVRTDVQASIVRKRRCRSLRPPCQSGCAAGWSKTGWFVFWPAAVHPS